MCITSGAADGDGVGAGVFVGLAVGVEVGDEVGVDVGVALGELLGPGLFEGAETGGEDELPPPQAANIEQESATKNALRIAIMTCGPPWPHGARNL